MVCAPPLLIPKRERFIIKDPHGVGMSSSTGKSPHARRGEKVISVRSILDLDVWTIQGERLSRVRRKSLTIKVYGWNLEIH